MADTRQESEVLFYENDNVLRITNAHNSLTDEYINDATVYVTLRDLNDNEVAGETWPKQLAYVTDSNGEYRTILPYDLTLSVNTNYYADITFDGGEDLRGAWRRYVRVIRRK